jgi:hypothetical protein
MLVIKARVDGISVAPEIPIRALAAISIPGFDRVGCQQGHDQETSGAHQQQSAAPDTVTEIPHGDEETCQQESVDV